MTSLNEPVHLVEYDAEWPRSFDLARNRISAALHLDPEQIQHIGSTAVPDLVAKPIIDIMLGVPSFPPDQTTVERLVALGYELLGEAGVSGRLYFRRRGLVSFNLHVVAIQCKHWVSNLALRDYLRANATARDRYAEAKRAAVASGAADLLTYSAAKGSVIRELIAEATPFQRRR